MGLFGNKGLSGEAVIMATLVTFGQSIHAVGSASGRHLDEAWDIFLNTLDLMVDGKFIPESSGFGLTEIVNFPENHDVVLDLIKIRSRNDQVQSFIKSHQRSLELQFSPNAIDSRIDWKPENFADVLTRMTRNSFSNFGTTERDQEFIAITGVFMMTLVSDTQRESRSNKTFRRIIGYEFVLKWLAEWNLRERLVP
jgi:hypothetical protein